MLDMLRAKLSARPLPNVKPLQSGEKALIELQGRADRVLALNVLHELGDQALGRLVSLMAPAGRAVFVDWNAEVERPVGPPRGHVFAPAEARARLVRLGLLVAEERLFLYHYGLVCRGDAEVRRP